LKSGDAKLKGLLSKDNASQLPNTTNFRDLCIPQTIEEGLHVLRLILKGKYYYHVFQQRHHELLQQDCLCEELRKKLMVKAIYHNSKVVEIGSRL